MAVPLDEHFNIHNEMKPYIVFCYDDPSSNRTIDIACYRQYMQHLHEISGVVFSLLNS